MTEAIEPAALTALTITVPFDVGQALFTALDEPVSEAGGALSLVEIDGPGAAASLDPHASVWRLEILVDTQEAPHWRARLAEGIANTPAGAAEGDIHEALVGPEDWVARVQAVLSPVHAGRFVIHGAHDRATAGGSPFAIEIAAAQAFGTGHHATTRQCLLAIDALAARGFTPRHALDIGTGSGVLAIATAKLFACPVLATDIDCIAIPIARANADLNGAGAYVTTIVADGCDHADIIAAAPFDLILANILSEPLMALAPDIARHMAPDGYAILSGLLTDQIAELATHFQVHGLRLRETLIENGWAALILSPNT